MRSVSLVSLSSVSRPESFLVPTGGITLPLLFSSTLDLPAEDESVLVLFCCIEKSSGSGGCCLPFDAGTLQEIEFDSVNRFTPSSLQ